MLTWQNMPGLSSLFKGDIHAKLDREKRGTHTSWWFWPLMNLSYCNPIIIIRSCRRTALSIIILVFEYEMTIFFFFFAFFQYLCSIALKASKILPICCPALDISIYFPFPSGIDPHHQFLPDPFFLRIQDAVCWVIEMGETWWEIKQLFQLNLESLFTDFCKAPQQSIHKRKTFFSTLHCCYWSILHYFFPFFS